ncbi:hypothetical protein E8E13_010807 [Curvularia kusanoi]|uniref:Zn(2)-C6 fungal-type domain-containing protein n=1 Tax=Curvularia kusanoi TaxID=90978 RepID=A0A9P4TNS2_CURKU|nr:hypothetical protein E8E13_010807 [Curvularia kusanoi]
MASRYTSGKVAIPKLDRGLHPPPPKGPPSQNREDRVVRACKNCRKRKVKCSGDVPRCVVCQTNDLNCVYEQSRRDRLKEASDLNYVFLNLFKDISPRLGDEDRKRIQDVIDVAEDDILEPSSTAVSVKSLGKRSRNRSASQSPDDIGPTKKQGEAHVTASVGSNEDLDHLDEDLMRSLDARQTGYVGQNSEVQWLRSVQRQSRGEPMGMPYGPPGSSAHAIDERAKALHERRTYDTFAPTTTVTEATFYLDNDNIDLEIAVNAYELPDPDLAEQLLECYMNTIHNSFPVVPLNFDAQARKFISADIQQSIKALLQELEDWSNRTLGQDTPSPGSAHAHQLERETMLLRMSYWSTRISITRPCLCRTERRIKNQSDSSAKFNSDMALSCVESARALTALFPATPDPQFVYLKAPWWNVVHIIMQCAAVLLLEIGYQNQHVKYSNSGITSDLQKLVSWLHLIGQKDSCARRAYLVLQRISRDVAPHLRLKADEALSENAASEKTANLPNSFFASSTSQQNDDGTWIQGHPFVSQTADIDPQLSSPDDQYLMLPLSEFSADDRMGAGGMPILNGSGNPFVNSWDECMPFDVQNFWLQDRSFVANSSAFSGDVRTHPWEEFQGQYQQQDQRPGSTADRVDGTGL